MRFVRSPMWCMFLFVKQKTAYEMRISDWSSDVCSSDLSIGAARKPKVQRQRVQHGAGIRIGACQRIVMGGGEADVAATQKRVDRGEIGRASRRERECPYV